MTKDQTALSVVKRFMDAWDAKDYQVLENIVAGECIFRSSVGAEPGETVVGKVAVLARMRDMIAEETENESDSGRFWSVDGQVFAEWSYQSVNSDGRAVTVRGMDRIHVVDGKIMEIDAFRKSF